MNRLTTELCGAYMPKALCSIDRLGEADDCDFCGDYCKATRTDSEGQCDDGCAIQQCFNRLGEYEETGCTPEQLKEIDRSYAELANEVMQYRKLGGIEELRKMKESAFSGMELANIWMKTERLKKYEAIGTVEECQEAMEKQIVARTFDGRAILRDSYEGEICREVGTESWQY